MQHPIALLAQHLADIAPWRRVDWSVRRLQPQWLLFDRAPDRGADERCGAIAASLIGAAIGRTVEQEPLRLKPSNAPVYTSPRRDVREMLREQGDGMLHPGSRKSEPRFGQDPQARESVPLFGAAPQLRPLYDPHNEGVIPAPPQPALPRHAPTPLPQK